MLSAIFLTDEPIRVNGLVGLLVGFVGVIIVTSPGLTGDKSSLTGELALLGAAFSYAAGAVYSRRNVRGLPPMIPAVFQVSFAAIIVTTLAVVFEHPWTATPDAQAVFSILWLGMLGSGVAYLLVFRLFAHWGATRTTLVAYLLPVVGIDAGVPRARRADRRAPDPGTALDHRGRVPREQQVRPAPGLRAGAAHRGDLAGHRRATRRVSRRSRAGSPPRRSALTSPRAGVTSLRSAASPSLTDPQAAARTVADSRSGATPDSGATLRATRMQRTRRASASRRPPLAGSPRGRPRRCRRRRRA